MAAQQGQPIQPLRGDRCQRTSSDTWPPVDKFWRSAATRSLRTAPSSSSDSEQRSLRTFPKRRSQGVTPAWSRWCGFLRQTPVPQSASIRLPTDGVKNLSGAKLTWGEIKSTRGRQGMGALRTTGLGNFLLTLFLVPPRPISATLADYCRRKSLIVRVADCRCRIMSRLL